MSKILTIATRFILTVRVISNIGIKPVLRAAPRRPEAAVSGNWVGSYDWFVERVAPKFYVLASHETAPQMSLLPFREVAILTRRLLSGLGQGLLSLQAASTGRSFQFFTHNACNTGKIGAQRKFCPGDCDCYEIFYLIAS